MVRIDIWDVQKPEDAVPVNCGFPRHLEERYTWGKKLGKGGFGNVKVVLEKITGREFACKSISKRLDVPNFSPQKQAAHLDNVRREIAVLKRLKGVLNVAQLKEALEDDSCIHIVMEYCRGGELWNCIGKRHYGEGTVASYMRAVLRTIAQCHAQKILHRDVKPGNFMLLEDQPLSPVKAIDFGLAVFFEPASLPRRDLGLEGTPWFMSPETLSSEVGPSADVWAAGVMAFQLLSGYLPFDDHRNRDQPALSKIWKAILTEEVSFKGSAWQKVPEEAKDFVKLLLNKDPSKRPTAQEAMKHPWLLNRRKADRQSGAPLESTVVQRIQRYGQGNALKRTIFELIAQEILRMAPDTPDPSNHSQALQDSPAGHAGMLKRDADEQTGGSQRTLQVLTNIKRRKSQKALAHLVQGPGGGAMEGPPLIHRDHHSVHAGMEYFKARGESVHNGKQALELSKEGRPTSVHGGSSYWRIMRATATALKWKTDRLQKRGSYIRTMPRCEDEREEQRKAARLSLDTSAHASLEYHKILQQCSSSPLRSQGVGDAEYMPSGVPSVPEDASMGGSATMSTSLNSSASDLPELAVLGGLTFAVGGSGSSQGMATPPSKRTAEKVIPSPSPALPTDTGADEEEGEGRQVRGRHAYRQFLLGHGDSTGAAVGNPSDSQRSFLDSSHRSHSFSELNGDRPSLIRASLPIPRPRRSLDVRPSGYASMPKASSFADASMGRSSLDAGDLRHSSTDLGDMSIPGLPRIKKVSFGAAESPRSVASSPGGARNYFANLESVPGADISRPKRPEGSGSGRARSNFVLPTAPSPRLTSGSQPHVPSKSLAQPPQAPAAMGVGATQEVPGASRAARPAEGAKDGSTELGVATSEGNGVEASRLIGTIDTKEMKELMRRLNFTKEAETVSEEDLAEGLRQLGYHLRPHEMRMLAEQVDPQQSNTGNISKSAFLASQIDWHQEDYRELWLEAAKKVFSDFERDSGGKISSAALTNLIRQKLPSAEVEYAVEDALVEAGYADEEEVDFDAFLRLLRSGTDNSLDHFEARLRNPASQDSLAWMGSPSCSTHALQPLASTSNLNLPTVAEEQ